MIELRYFVTTHVAQVLHEHEKDIIGCRTHPEQQRKVQLQYRTREPSDRLGLTTISDDWTDWQDIPTIEDDTPVLNELDMFKYMGIV